MTREEIYEFLGWTSKGDPIIGDLSYRIIELVRYAEERALTNQKARYYQEGYEAGVHDEREACAEMVERGVGDWLLGRKIAAAIRQRGEK